MCYSYLNFSTVNITANLYNLYVRNVFITLYLIFCLENAIAGTGAWDCLYSKSISKAGLINLQVIDNTNDTTTFYSELNTYRKASLKYCTTKTLKLNYYLLNTS